MKNAILYVICMITVLLTIVSCDQPPKNYKPFPLAKVNSYLPAKEGDTLLYTNGVDTACYIVNMCSSGYSMTSDDSGGTEFVPENWEPIQDVRCEMYDLKYIMITEDGERVEVNVSCNGRKYLSYLFYYLDKISSNDSVNNNNNYYVCNKIIRCEPTFSEDLIKEGFEWIKCKESDYDLILDFIEDEVHLNNYKFYQKEDYNFMDKYTVDNVIVMGRGLIMFTDLDGNSWKLIGQ